MSEVHSFISNSPVTFWLPRENYGWSPVTTHGLLRSAKHHPDAVVMSMYDLPEATVNRISRLIDYISQMPINYKMNN